MSDGVTHHLCLTVSPPSRGFSQPCWPGPCLFLVAAVIAIALGWFAQKCQEGQLQAEPDAACPAARRLVEVVGREKREAEGAGSIG